MKDLFNLANLTDAYRKVVSANSTVMEKLGTVTQELKEERFILSKQQ